MITLKLNEEQNGLKLIQVKDGFVVVDINLPITPFKDACYNEVVPFYKNGDSFHLHHDKVLSKEQPFGIDGKTNIFDGIHKIIFATPNLNLEGVPVIKEKELPFDKLCYYDRRYSDFSIKEEYGYDKEEVEATGDFSKKDCACDNCFYGRAKLANQLIEQAQQNLFTEEQVREALLEVSLWGQVRTTRFEDINKIIQSLKQPTVEIIFENNIPVKAIML